MRSSLLSLAAAFALAGFSSALPAEQKIDIGLYNFLSKRTIVSPDNTCGNVGAGANNSYICNATSSSAGCCSSSGYCGSTSDYCGTGCQSAFGACTGSESSSPTTSTTTCGANNGNLSCGSGLCCSQAGYCGNTTDYCAADNCQSAFGACNADSPAPSSGGTCGPNFGNAVCANNQCCSQAGYCGNSSDYCADPGSCVLQYGRCDSNSTPAGESTLYDSRPLLGSVSYALDIDDCTASNVVALTYDDGPYEYTAELLDLLKEYNFTATFFITGNNNGKGEIDTTAPYPNLVNRMIAEGHQVASHTWSHYNLSDVSHELRLEQVVKNEMAIRNIIGKYPTYIRPPYSECSEASGCTQDLSALGYHRILFDLDTQDYLNPLPSQIQNSKDIVKTALARTDATDYLSIQHDIVAQSVMNLTSYYFDLIKAKGWSGVTVGECLGDAEENWYRASNVTSGVSVTTTGFTSETAVSTASSVETGGGALTTTDAATATATGESGETGVGSTAYSGPSGSSGSSGSDSTASGYSTGYAVSSATGSSASATSYPWGGESSIYSSENAASSATENSPVATSYPWGGESGGESSTYSSGFVISTASKSDSASPSSTSSPWGSGGGSSSDGSSNGGSSGSGSSSNGSSGGGSSSGSSPGEISWGGEGSKTTDCKTSAVATVTATATAGSSPSSSSSCAVSVGSFCLSISTFSDKTQCRAAASACFSEALTCTSKAGWLNRASCSKASSVCTKLSLYCLSCTGSKSCLNSAFKY